MTSPSPVWCLVSARMRSARCPGKAMAPLAGRPLIEHLLERMENIEGVDGVALATSTSPENDVLEAVARRRGIPVFRGDEDDVLGRHVEAARRFGAAHVVRVTGDNPLTDRGLVRRLVEVHRKENADYTYVPGDALLMGILPEVVSRDALERAHRLGEARHRSELVTLYIKENPDRFRIRRVAMPPELYRPAYRLTVDEPEDVELVRRIFERLYRPGKILETVEAIRLLDDEPELARINAHVRHKPHNLRSVRMDGTR